ncbi:hypothetical protein [Streptomyces synnematoformans]|uniref:Uncharacterized protein n=1 Tax=Streptomyces synnematoformans TaxID=415721 RepID=A0ABN2YYI6_9ACTN
MGSEQTGTGRVTVYPLTHHWPDRRCLLAYTTTGDFGTTAIVGVLPVPELEHPDLLAVAAAHHAQGLYSSRGGHENACAGWVICTGWSARIGGSGPRLDVQSTAWSLRPDRRIPLAEQMYGHDILHTGTFTLDDGELMKQALRLAP